MYGELNPTRLLPLTLITERLVIAGSAVSHPNRLVDMVNERDADYLMLSDATISETGSRRVVSEAGVAQIRLSEVLFLYMTDPTQVAGNVWMRKQPVPATLLVPPFTVEGTIYLPYEAELRAAVEASTDRFVPVTSASFWSYSMGESPTSVDLLIVNHCRAHVSLAPDTQWNSEVPREASNRSPW